MRICSLDGCERKHYGMGLCAPHYHEATRDKRKARDMRNVEKIKLQRRTSYLANVEKNKATSQSWRKANPEKVKAQKQRHSVARSDHIKARVRKWVKANPEKRRANVSKWDKANRDQCAAKLAKRRAKKLNATPSWANHFFMKEAYHLAKLRTKMLGFAWHVDHIVPLDSDIVCGLHVEHNLQVIPAFNNRSKGNRVWPDMP